MLEILVHENGLNQFGVVNSHIHFVIGVSGPCIINDMIDTSDSR